MTLNCHHLIVFGAIYQLPTSEQKTKGATAFFLFRNEIRVNGLKLKD